LPRRGLSFNVIPAGQQRTSTEAISVSLAQELGTTIRTAITEWPQTVRLITLFAALTTPIALLVLLLILLRL
jgi:hypothetical protein